MNKLTSLLTTLLLLTTAAYAATLPASEDTSSSRGKLTIATNKAATLPVDSSRHAFVYFNLSELPAGTQLRYARLRLYLPSVVRAGAGLTLHKITGQWDEAIASAEPAFNATPITTLLPVSLGKKRFVSVDVTATVQGWLASPASNEGFAIAAVTAASAKLTASVLIGAKEGSGSGYPAELEVEIADDAIAPGSIGTTQLATGAVQSGNIATGAVGNSQLASDLTLGGTTTGTFNGSFSLPATSSATVGVITQNGSPLIHTFGTNGFFAGLGAGNFTMTGNSNVAIGFSALAGNTTGYQNTAIGVRALQLNSSGKENTANGENSLGANTSGSNNTAIGRGALQANTTGDNNTASGVSALISNTTGYNNTASGVNALINNLTGFSNAATGTNALFSNTEGSGNTAFGESALKSNTTGNNNVANGNAALLNNTTGHNNVAIGHDALLNNTTGNTNTALGLSAGNALTTGSDNIAIGNAGVAAESNTIRIGTQGIQTKTFIAGIRGITTGVNDAIQLVIDSNGQIGTISSSRRYKEDIADMGDVSARLDTLRPVTFRYKKTYADGGKPVQYGLIAEEVAEVFPELAVFNNEGQPETVKYQDLTPLLLNEFLKERRHAKAVEASLREENADLKKRLERLETLLPTTTQSGASSILR